MLPKMLPASEVRNKFASVLSGVKRDGSPCYVTRNGRAVAALISIEALEGLLSEVEDRLDEADPKLAFEVRESRRQYKAGRSKSLKDIR